MYTDAIMYHSVTFAITITTLLHQFLHIHLGQPHLRGSHLALSLL